MPTPDYSVPLSSAALPAPELTTARVFPVQIQRAATLLDSIQTEGIPSDRALQHAFRADRKMGKRDRTQLQVLVFFVLRHWRLLDTLLGAPADIERGTSLRRLGVALSLAGQLDDTLAALTGVNGPELSSRREENLSLAARLSLTDADMSRLQTAFGIDAVAVGQVLLERAPLDIRVNTRVMTTHALQAELHAAGIPSAPIPGLPLGLRLADNTALTTLDLFKTGAFEIQAAGSQWIIEACQADEGMRVLDLCAGAGGKALGLAQAVGETGRVLACDVDFERLSRLPERSDRAGWKNIECQPIDHSRDREVLRRAPFDRVLIDAPCSGSGTFRRHPELKQAAIDLSALCALQQQLLDDAADVTRPGGLLVYATCSLWVEENEAQVHAFLQRHPDWRLDHLPDSIARYVHVTQVGDASGMARIRPDVHGGDGFFFAVLRAPESPE
ncbi:MAG: RsmB/NOP family class I SAM-dependent RNA methyltransferase [Halothiobacillus sp.]